uniref:Uncharacterized protein n=1 Tax=Caenorhabditis japonica TaxID=281687 RepID=A0A8R1HNT8_CAEJA
MSSTANFIVSGVLADGTPIVFGSLASDGTSAPIIHHVNSASQFQAESWDGEHAENEHHDEDEAVRRFSVYLEDGGEIGAKVEEDEEQPIASSGQFERQRSASLAAALLELDPRGVPLVQFFKLATNEPLLEVDEGEDEVEPSGAELVLSQLLFTLRSLKMSGADAKHSEAVQRLRELEEELRAAGAVTPADPAVSEAVARALAVAGAGRDVQIRVNQSKHTTTTKTVYDTETSAMAHMDTDQIRNLQQEILADISSAAEQHAGQDSGTTQKRETAEEGFTNEDGSVVVSKKMTRVVTTTRTTLPGEGEEPSAPESPVESLGSVKDRIARFEQLKDFHPDPSASGAPSSLTSSQIQEESSEILPEEQEPEHPYIPEPDHSKVIEQVQVQVHVEDEEGEEVHVEDETAPVAPDRHHGLTESSIGIVITPHTPIPPEHPEEHLKDEDEPREPLEPSEPEQVAHAQLKDTREYSDEELAQELQPSEEQVSTAEIKDIKSYSPTSSEDERSSQKQPISPPIPQERHVVHPVASESTHEDEELAAHFVAESFEKQEDHHAENIEQEPVYRGHHSPGQTSPIVAEHPIAQEYAESVTSHDEGDNLSLKSGHDPEIAKHSVESVPEEDDETGRLGDFAKKAGMVAGAAAAAPVAIAAVGVKAAYDVFTKSDDGEKELKEDVPTEAAEAESFHVVSETTTTREYSGEPEGVCPEPESPLNYNEEKPETPEVSEQDRPHVIETTTTTTVTREIQNEPHQELSAVSPNVSSTHEEPAEIITTITREVVETVEGEEPEHRYIETTTTTFKKEEYDEPEQQQPHIVETSAITTIPREFRESAPAPESPAVSEYDTKEVSVSPSFSAPSPSLEHEHLITETTTTTSVTREFRQEPEAADSEDELAKEITTTTTVTREYQEEPEQDPQEHLIKETTTTTSVTREFHGDEQQESPAESVKDVLISASPALSSHAEPEQQVAESPVPSEKESQPDSQVVTETTTTTVTTREYFEDPAQESYSPVPSSRAESDRPTAVSPAISEMAHADVSQIQEQKVEISESPTDDGKTSPAPPSHVESERPVSQSPAISEKLQSEEPHFVTETVTTTTVTREYHEKEPEHHHDSPTQFQPHEQQPTSSPGSDDDSDGEGFGRKALGFAKKAGMAAGAVVAAPVALAAVGAKSAYDALTKSDDEEEEPKEHIIPETTTTSAWTSEYVEDKEDFDSAPAVQKVYQKPESPIEEGVPQVVETFTTTTVTREAEEPQQPDEPEHLYERSETAGESRAESEHSLPHVVETTTTTVVTRELHDDDFERSESPKGKEESEIASSVPSTHAETEHQITESPVPSERDIQPEGQVITETTTTTITTVTREFHEDDYERSESPEAKEDLTVVSPVPSSHAESDRQIPESPVVTETTTTTTTATRDFHDDELPESPIRSVKETSTAASPVPSEKESQPDEPIVTETTTTTVVTREFHDDDFERSESPKGKKKSEIASPVPSSHAESEHQITESPVPSEKDIQPESHYVTETTATTTTTLTREFHDGDYECPESPEAKEEPTVASPVPSSHAESDRQVLESPVSSEREIQPESHVVTETTTTTTTVSREFHDDERPESPTRSVKETSIAASPVPSDKESRPGSQIVTETTTTREYFEEQEPVRESYSPTPSSRAESERPVAESPAISERAHADVSQIQEQHEGRAASPIGYGKTSPAPSSHVESDRPVSQSPAISEKLQSAEPHFITETVTTTTVTREYHEEDSEHRHESPTQFQTYEQQPRSSSGSDDDSDCEGFGRKALGFAKKAGMAAGAVVAAPVALAAVGAKSAYDALTKSDDEEEEPKEREFQESTVTAFVEQRQEEPQHFEESERLYEESVEKEISSPHVVETTTTTVVSKEFHDEEHDCSESTTESFKEAAASPTPSAQVESDYPASPAVSEQEHPHVVETTTTTIETQEHPIDSKDRIMEEEPYHGEAESPTEFAQQPESPVPVPQEEDLVKETTTTTTVTREFYDEPTEALSTTGEVYNSPEHPEHHISELTETVTHEVPEDQDHHALADDSERHPHAIETTTTTTVTREFYEDEPEQSPAGTPAESEKSLPQVVETATTETREFYDDDYEHSESSAHEAVVAASPAPSSHIESERAGSPIVSEKEIPQIIETTTTTTTSREFYEAPEEPVPTEPEYHQKLEEEERDTKASPIELESPAEPSVSQVIETTTTTTTIGGEHEPYRFESSELTEQEGEESDGEGFGSKVLGFAKKAGMAAGAVVAAPVALAAVGAKSAYDALKKSDDEEETEEHNLGEPSERRDLEFPVASERNESPVPSEPSDRFEKESYGQEPVPESPVPSESSSQIEKVQEHPDGHHFTETTTTTTVTRKYFDDEEELAQEPSEKSYTSDQTHEHPTVPSPSITDQENVHHTETTTSTSITRDYREEDPRVEKQESEEDQHGPMESTTTFTRDVYEPAEGEEPAHHFVETTTTTTVRKEYSDDEEDREEAGVPEEEDPHVVETITTTRVTREYDDEEKPSDSEIPHVTETTTTTTVTREYYGEKPDDTESPDGSEEDQSVGDDKEVSSPTNESVTSVSHEVHEDEPHLVETITTTTVTREFHTEPEEAAEDSVELVKETVTTTTVTSEYPADPQVESPPSEKEDIEESTLSADREEEPKVIETTTTTTVTRDYYEDEPEYVTESERLSEQAHSPAVTPAESEKSLPHVVETTTTETREFHYQPEGSVKEESIPASPTPSSHVESEVLFDKEPSHHLVTETTTTTATTHGFFGEEPEVPAQRDYPLEEAEAGFPQQIERDSQPLPSETRSIYEEEFDTQYPQEQYHPESPVPTEQAPLLAEQPQQHGDSGEESEGEGFGSKMLGFAKKAGMAAGAVVAAPVALAAVGAKSAYDALRKSDDEEEPEEHFLGESREKRDIDSPVAKEVGHYESPVPSEPSTELEKHPYTQESVHEEVPSEFKPQEPEEPVHFTETSTAATTLSQKHFDEEEAPIETEFIPTVPEQHHREEESALSPVPSHKSEELKQFQDEQSSDSSEQDQELAQEQKPELDRQGSYSSGYSPKSPRSSPIEPELRQNVETTTTTVTTLSHETPEDAEKQDTLSQASSEIDIAKDTNTISEQFEPRETHQEEIQFEEFEPTPHSHDIAASPVLSEKSLEDQVASEELSEPAPSSHIESERAVSPSYLTETAPREDQPEHHVIDTTTTTIVTQEYHESPAASNISLASSSSHAHSTTDLDREIVSVDEPADSRASPSHVEPEYHQQSGSPIPSEKLVTRIEETFTTEEPSELQKQLEFPAGQYQQEQFHPESPEPTEQAPLLTEQQHHQELQGSEEDSDGEGFGSKMLGFAKKAGMAAGAVVAAPVALAAVGAKSAYDALRKSDDEEEPEEQEHLLGKSRESPVVQEIGHQDYEPVQESPAPSEQSYQFEKESVHLEGHHYTETTTRTTVTRDYFDDEQDKEQGSPSQSPSISEQDQKKEQEHPHHIESTTTTTVSRDYHDDSHQQISTEPPTEPSSFEEPAQTTTVTREVFETAKGEEPEHHYIETTTTTTITKEEYEEPEGHQDGQASPTHSEEPHIVETTTTVIREPYEEPEGFRPPSGSEADDEGHAPRYMETTTTTTVTREYEVSEDEEDYPQKEGSPVPSDSEQSVTHVVEKTTTTTVTQEKFEPEDYEQHDYPTETQKQLESPVPPEKEDHGFVKTTTTTVVTREHFEPEDVSSDCHGSPTLSEESERYDIDTATMTTVTQEHFEQPDSEELTSRSPTHYEREQTSPASQKSPITSTSSLHEHFEPEKEHYVVEKQELSSSSFEHHVTRVEETTTTTVSRELHEEEPEFPAGQCYQDQYHHESPVPTEQAPLLTEQQQHQELKESGDESEKEGFGSKMLGFAKKAGMAAGAVVAAPVALAAVGAKSAYDALRKSDDEEEPEEQERLFGESRERRDLESPVVSQQHYAPEPIHESSEFSSHFEGEEKSAQPTATFYEPEEEDRAGELEDHPATSEPKFITPTHSVEPEHQKPDNVEDPEYVIDSEDYQVATEEEPRISSPVHSDSDEVSHYQEEEHDTTRTPVVTERIDAPYVVESEEYAFERRDEPRIASPTQQDENEEDVIESAAYPRDEANFENLENRSTSESGGSPRPFEDSTTTTVISVHHEPPAIPEPEIDEEDALEQEGNSIIDSQDYDSHTTVTTVEAVEPVVQTDTSPTVVTTVSTEHLDTTHEHFDQEHFDPENEEETHDFVRTTTTTTSHEEPEEEQYVVDSQEYQRSGHESPVLSVKSEANDEDIERRRIETTTTTTVTKEYVEPEEHVVESQEYTSGSPVPSERSADHGIYHEHYQPEEPQEETEQKVSPGGDEEDEDVHGYIKTTTTTTTVTTEHTEPEEHVVESHEYTSGSPVPSERFADHGIYREHSQPEEPQEETEQKVSPGGDEEDEDVHGYIRTTTTTTTVTTEHAEPEEHVVESQEYTSGSPVPSERSVDHGETEQKVSLGGEEDEDVHGYIRTTTTTTTVTTEHTEPEEHVVESREYTSGSPIPSERSVTHGFKRADSREHYEPEEHQVENEHSHSPTDREEEDVHGYIKTTTTTTVTKEHTEPEEHVVESHEYTSTSPVLSEHSVTRGVERTDSREHYEPEERQVEGEHKLSPSGEEEEDVHGYIKTTTTTTVTKEQFEPEEHLVESQEYTSASPVPSEGSVLQAVEPVTRELKKDEEEDVHGFIKTTTTTTVTKEHVEPEEEHHVVESHEYTSGSPIPSEGSISRLVETLTTTTVTCENFDREEEHESPAPTEQAPLLTEQQQPHELEDSGDESEKEGFGSKMFGFAKKAGMAAGAVVAAPVALAAIGAKSAYDALRKSDDEEEPERQEHLLGESREKRDLDSPVASAQDEPIHYQTTDLQEPEKRIESHETHDSESEGSFVDHGEQNQGLPLQSKEAAFDLSREDIAEQTAEKLVSEVFQPLDRTLIESEQYRSSIESLNRPSPIPAEHKKSSHDDLTSEAFQNVTKLSYGDAETYDHDHDHDSKDDVDEKEEWKVYDRHGEVLEEFSTQLTEDVIHEAEDDATYHLTRQEEEQKQSTEISPRRSTFLKQESCQEISNEPEVDYYSDLQEKLNILAGEKSNLGAHVEEELPSTASDQLDVIHESDNEQQEHQEQLEQEKEEEAENTAMELVNQVLEQVVTELSEGEDEDQKTMTSDAYLTAASEGEGKDDQYDTCVTSQDDTYESAQGWTSQDSEYTTATSQAPSRLSDSDGEHTARDRDLERQETSTPQAMLSPVDSDRQFTVQQDYDVQVPALPSIRAFEPEDFMQSTARSTPDVALQVTIEEEDESDDKLPISPSGVLLPPTSDPGRPVSPVPPRRAATEQDGGVFVFVREEDTIVEPTPPPDVGVTAQKEDVQETERIHGVAMEASSDPANSESSRYSRQLSDLSSSAESHADTVIRVEGERSGSSDSLEVISVISGDKEKSPETVHEPVVETGVEQKTSTPTIPEDPIVHQTLPTEAEQLGFEIYDADTEEPPQVPIEELETVEEEPEDSDSLNEGNGSGHSSVGVPADTLAMIGKYRHQSSDNLSLTSLQEFERLEKEVGARGDGSLTRSEIELLMAGRLNKSGEGSVSSLAEFERLEKEITENQSPTDDVMMLSDIREESEAEDMSIRDDDEEEVIGSDTELHSRPVQEEDLRAATPVAPSPTDSLEHQVDPMQFQYLETSTDSLEPTFQEIEVEQRADSAEDTSLAEYEMVPRVMETSTTDSLDGGIAPTEKDSLLEGASQGIESTQSTHGMLSGDTVGNVVTDDEDKDSLDGEVSSMLQSYPTTLTTFQTTVVGPDGTVQTISRRVETRVTDPLVSHVTFTGTESQERLDQLPHEEQFETVDTEGNVTRTTFRREQEHHY